MDHYNPRRLYIPLYCSQSTQTQPESDSEADSSDFPPAKIGKRMSPASAMRRNPPSTEESPQLHHRQRHDAGLGQNNVVNMVNAAPPARHRKVIPLAPPLFAGNHADRQPMLTTNVNARLFTLIRPNLYRSKTPKPKASPRNAC